MDASTLLALALTCAPRVHADTAAALVKVESNLNPWAIGVVGGVLQRQPSSHAQALSTATFLQRNGWNFSVGLAQINVANLRRMGISLEDAFDPCVNLKAMQTILEDCYRRARRAAPGDASQARLQRALSCYYSGNFHTGFQHGYVRKLLWAANQSSRGGLVN